REQRRGALKGCLSGRGLEAVHQARTIEVVLVGDLEPRGSGRREAETPARGARRADAGHNRPDVQLAAAPAAEHHREAASVESNPAVARDDSGVDERAAVER